MMKSLHALFMLFALTGCGGLSAIPLAADGGDLVSGAGTAVRRDALTTWDIWGADGDFNSAPGASGKPSSAGHVEGYWVYALNSSNYLAYSQKTVDDNYTWGYDYTDTYASAPAPVRTIDSYGCESVFVQQSDGRIAWLVEEWQGEFWCRLDETVRVLPTAVGSGPAASSWGSTNSQRYDVFARRSSDGKLLKNTFQGTTPTSGTWSDWYAFSDGAIAAGTDPAAVSWGTDRIDVFVTGTDGWLYQKTYTVSGGIGSWSSWSGLGVYVNNVNSSPAVASKGSGNLEVVVRRSPNNDYWARSYNNGSWGSLRQCGGVFTSKPTASGAYNSGTGTNSDLRVWGRGTDDAIYSGICN